MGLRAVRSIVFVMIFIFTSCVSSDQSEKYEISRIAWDYSSMKRLVPQKNRTISYASYPRIIKVDNGDYLCVYEANRSIEMIRSDDRGESWQQAETIAPYSDGIARTVPEIIQLTNGRIIVCYNLRPKMDNADHDKKFAIALRTSDDNGSSWSKEKVVFNASYKSSEGCWEPMIIEPPTGELQLYFANEADFSQSGEQNITMYRSIDRGENWSLNGVVSYNKGSRDGMPVLLVLEDSDEIVMAIEDNSSYNFKPVIIRTSIRDSWKRSSRHYALTHDLENGTYQGAPYICRLPSGNILLSYQGTENRGGSHELSNSTMYVESGNSRAMDFGQKTTPFNIPIGSSALWNSVSVIDGKICALTSSNGIGGINQQVWSIWGYEIRNHRIPEKSKYTEKDIPAFFIGHRGESNLKVDLYYDEISLYIKSSVKGTGFTVYLDPQGLKTKGSSSGIYSFAVTSDGSFIRQEGSSGEWELLETMTEKLMIEEEDERWNSIMAIKWSDIGGKPQDGKEIGFSLSLTAEDYIEDMVLSDRDKPNTWLTIRL